jgi:hypothetical protein
MELNSESKFETKSIVERDNFVLVQIVPKGKEVTVTSKMMVQENTETDFVVVPKSKSKLYSTITL